jgi:large repetitive protein
MTKTLTPSFFLIPLIASLLSACGAGSDSNVAGLSGADAAAENGRSLSRSELVAKDVASLTRQAALAQWSPLTTLPITPISGANLPDGRLMFWSAEDRFGFGTDLGRTYSVLYDPSTGQATERLVTETGHDMFCPGTSMLADGRLLVNGGLSSGKTSIFDASNNTWSTGAAMNIPRAYNASAPLANGSVLTLGGSWAGGVGNKHGEVWSAASGWQRLSGVPIDAMLSVDASRNFGMDSHLWLLASGNGRVLHAGPGMAMNWIDTRGSGRVTPAGSRGDDEFSISGNTVMYDAGKILKTGGGPGYDSVNANPNSYLIDTSTGSAKVRKINAMAYRRAFQNSVVLPNGQVIVVGGQTYAVGFSDANSVLVPELFDPSTEAFVALAPIAAPRNYHSFALLLPDATVLSGGGGLCGTGCAANHSDFQILTPPYLYNADGSKAARPSLLSVPRTAAHGSTIRVTTDSAVTSASIVRLSSVTHTVNNDQRRIGVPIRAVGNTTFDIDVPSNPGWAVPGEYMLFVMNANGTPSVAKTIRIAAPNGLWLTPPDDLFATVGAAFDVALSATSNGGGTISFAAQGLPAGLLLDAVTGRLSGAPTQAGEYLVNLSASNGSGSVSWQVPLLVRDPGAIRYVKFEALSEVAGNPWASMAEFELLDDLGRVLPRTGWSVSADSAEIAGENGAAANAIDGNLATIWHTQWQAASPAYPHNLVVSLGGAQSLGGFRYTPRSGGGNGTVATYRFYVSSDGVTWGSPLASGDLRQLGANSEVKTVYFGNVALGKVASQSSVFSQNPTPLASLAVDGNVEGDFTKSMGARTTSELNAWLEVDLGAPQSLHTVRLWNRSDAGADQLSDFFVLLSSQPMAGKSLAALLADPAVSQVRNTGVAGRPSTLSLAGTGRYLRVQLAGTNYLNLAEIEAYGHAAQNRAPTLVAPNPASLVQGTAASVQLSASDPDADPLTWSANGLPPGMVLSASSGLMSGTPVTPGGYSVQVSVNDGRGGSATTSFNWSVTASNVVIAPVAAPAVLSGGSANYSASATGAGLQYQWDFGDGTMGTPYSSSSTIAHQYANAGVYTVTLSVRDGAGKVSTRSFVQTVLGSTVSGRTPSSSSLVFEARSSGNARLWVVNPDNDSVSVFDTVTQALLAEIGVASQPRTLALAPSGRVWVVNKQAASLSLIDPSSLSVVQTIALARGSLPYGIVMGSDGSAYVALEGLGRVQKFNSAGTLTGDIALAGARHLAMSLDGSKLLVSRFVTAPQPGESSALVRNNLNGVLTGGEVTELDPATMARRRSFVLRHSDRPDSTISGRGVPNYLGAAAISPDGKSAWLPSKQDNIMRGVLRDGLGLDFQNSVRAISSRLDLVAQAEDYPARVDHDNSGLASAAVFHPSGAFVFVALETSRQVAILDAQGRRELFRIEAGRAPQGLTLSSDGRRLFVSNFMDRSVGMFDLAPLLDYGEYRTVQMATLNTVRTERLSAAVLKGKQFFYDARDTRLARDAYLSCASCHNDGAHDGRTWDFTGFGEGLRNTISLKGRAGVGQGLMHWTGNFDEVQDFEAQIRSFAQGTGLMSDALFNTGTRSQPLGDKKAGVSADLDALALYLGSLNSVAPSPFLAANGVLSNAAQNGKALFQDLNCASCHSGMAFTNSAAVAQMRDVGTLKASSGNRLGATLSALDVPTLKDVWATAPYLHDGSAANLSEAVVAHKNFSLGVADIASLASYLGELGGDEPAALTPSAVNGTSCAAEGGTCTLPAGQTATVYYGANGSMLRKTGVSASIACTSATFGDPAVGTAKTCVYVVNGSAPGTGTGLLGQYFNNVNLSGSPALQRVEAPNFDWQTGSPGTGVGVDNFSVRWVGTIEAPASGAASVQLVSDDGVRMWIDNKLVIDDWTAHSPKTTNVALTLTAGKRYPIMIEYFESGGGAVARLNWQLPGSTSYVAVPSARLYAANAPSVSNLALGKVATQSSTGWSATAARAVDGNTNGTFNSGSVTHTNSQGQPWWQVDLGASKRVDLVQLWNRSDCCADRLQNFVVFTSPNDMSGKTLAQLQADPLVTQRQVGASQVVPVIGVPIAVVGRYVRVQLLGSGYLSLAEVQVFGGNP